MSTARYLLQRTIDAQETGINGSAINAGTLTSNWVSVENFSQATIDIELTRSAATTLTFKVEFADTNSSPGASQIGAVPVANDAGSGTINYYEETFTVPSVSASRKYKFNVPINYKFIRVKNLTGTSAGASDTAIVTMLVTRN